MSVKISRVNLNNLWNSEFPLFIEQLSNITRKHNPATLHLEKPYTRVTVLLPQLAKIKAQELSNVLSNKMVDLDTERDVLLIGIQAQVKIYGKLSLPDMMPSRGSDETLFQHSWRPTLPQPTTTPKPNALTICWQITMPKRR
ncbi:MAG: hypothetical protein QM800_04585 [Paludibacter sp.]